MGSGLIVHLNAKQILFFKGFKNYIYFLSHSVFMRVCACVYVCVYAFVCMHVCVSVLCKCTTLHCMCEGRGTTLESESSLSTQEETWVISFGSKCR